MFFRSLRLLFMIAGMVGLLFISTGCSVIAYSDFEPENPYDDLPKSSVPEVMGLNLLSSDHC
ncbi:hypothetical protein [Maridesulfovibrio salexigens]|uniref:Lipoprotein n=1 Tax=Maridesulfovibrio salexigens (strain ATCC 14822 / DSM 2638 / NCIMB 8403 / VKM B-1763) TaxID=526222 RepID=C6C1N4_MARSD|nr:hypothetical protein [Maridesulfovibrio salexigens]ACS81209.1 hypothetical protein Desal_3158 [Maridesulfovibrio salexigens DSM 2638]